MAPPPACPAQAGLPGSWWTKAAEAGHAGAQLSLGVLLATQLDPPELTEARTWHFDGRSRVRPAGTRDVGYRMIARPLPDRLAVA